MKTKVLAMFALIDLVALGTTFAGEGWVSLTTADPSCPDDSSNRYVDCGNGTVTDNNTGLVWLKSAYCFTTTDWYDAEATASGVSHGLCGLTDNSSPGDWRLPSKVEWYWMIEAAVALGCTDQQLGGPSITNDAGTGCWGDGPSSFTSIQNDTYWSASSTAFEAIWTVRLNTGQLYGGSGKYSSLYIWPVRDGQ